MDRATIGARPGQVNEIPKFGTPCPNFRNSPMIASHHEDRATASRRSDAVEVDGDTPTLRLFALLEVIASQGPAVLAAGPGRGDRAAEADAAPHAAAARRRRPAAARERRPPLRHRRAPAPPGREPAAQRQPPRRAPRGAAPPGRGGRRELQHHRAVGQRGRLPRPRRDRRRRCASTCTRARACRCTARPAARSSWRR